MASKPGISRSWPRISGIRSERPALERLAVARADERDDRVVAVLGAAVLDRGEGRVLVAQLLDDLVDPGVVDDLDLGLEVEVLVVAELDLGRTGTVALKMSGLPSSAWTTSTSALASGRMSSWTIASR